MHPEVDLPKVLACPASMNGRASEERVTPESAKRRCRHDAAAVYSNNIIIMYRLLVVGGPAQSRVARGVPVGRRKGVLESRLQGYE